MFTNCTHPWSQPRSRNKTFRTKPPGGHAWLQDWMPEARRFCQECFVFESGLRTWVCAVSEKKRQEILFYYLIIYLFTYLIIPFYTEGSGWSKLQRLKSGPRDGEKQMLQALPQESLHWQKEEVSCVGLERPCSCWGTILLQAAAQKACTAHSYRIWLPQRMTEMQISCLINIRNIYIYFFKKFQLQISEVRSQVAVFLRGAGVSRRGHQMSCFDSGSISLLSRPSIKYFIPRIETRHNCSDLLYNNSVFLCFGEDFQGVQPRMLFLSLPLITIAHTICTTFVTHFLKPIYFFTIFPFFKLFYDMVNVLKFHNSS